MKFQCQESCGGKCCTAGWDGKATFIFLTFEDRMRLARFIKRSVSDFAQQGVFTFTRFTHKKSIQWYLKDSEKSCQFFKDGKCSVYEARPTQCRTFPYWPEYMKPKAWDEMSTHCPGINKGEENNELAIQQFCDQAAADDELG